MTKYNLAGKRILQIGCGAIGSCMLPLYDRHIQYNKGQIIVFDMREEAISKAIHSYPNIRFFHKKITQNNYKTILKKYLQPGDLLLDLAWYIDTLECITWCHENNVLYINTAVETWEEAECNFEDKRCQTLYSRQLLIRSETKEWKKGATAILTHGANPGWVSHATKLGINDWIQTMMKTHSNDKHLRKAWKAALSGNYAEAAKCMHIQVIHIAERDTQISGIPKRVGEFVNTWSPLGFVEEGTAPAELGWGTHETLKEGVNHYREGPCNQVFFDSMGMNTLVKSWVPSGDIVGMVVRHEEAFSISEHLSVYDAKGKAIYRPTVHYCYMSCGDSIASMYEVQANNYKMLPKERVLKEEIISGSDELGVFMLSNTYGGWWIGSILSCEEAQQLLPKQSATVIQVASSVLSAIYYAFQHPTEGVIHPDDMEPIEAMKPILPYLGKFVSFYKEWEPKHMSSKVRNHPDWIIQKLLVK